MTTLEEMVIQQLNDLLEQTEHLLSLESPLTGSAVPAPTAQGDILAATAADAWSLLPVGGDGEVLTADSGEAAGVKWGVQASVDAQYVVMALDAALTAERVLAASAPLALADGGAKGNATLSHNMSGVGAGTYTKVTVDVYGHTTGGALLAAGDLPSHTHAGAGEGGTVAHSALTGVTADQHHSQVHDVVGADHGLTGAQWDVVGATALNTLGLLTPSFNPGVSAAILRTDSNGFLQLEHLGIGILPSAIYGIYAATTGTNTIRAVNSSSGSGVSANSTNGIGVDASSGTGVGLKVNLTSTGGTIAEFYDNPTLMVAIQEGGYLDVAEYIRHLNDNDTYRRLRTDQMTDVVGGVTFLDMVEDTNDYFNIFPSGGGRVAIGTSTPSQTLHIYDPSSNVFALIETDKINGAAAFRLRNDVREWQVGINSSDQYQVRNNTAGVNPFIIDDGAGGPSLVITSAGIGVKTASPGSLMEWNFATDDLEFVDCDMAATSVSGLTGIIEVQGGGVTAYIPLYSSYS